MTQEQAQNATQSDVGGSEAPEAVPTPEGAREALVEQLAEAIRSCVVPSNEQLRDLLDAVLPLVEAHAAAQVEAAVSVVRAERDEARQLLATMDHFAEVAETCERKSNEWAAEVRALREKVAKVEAPHHPRPEGGRAVIAGGRRPQRDSALFVDYADVLCQAVANERHRVLREVRERVNRIQTTKERSSSYSRDDRSAADFKKDVLREIDYTEEASQ